MVFMKLKTESTLNKIAKSFLASTSPSVFFLARHVYHLPSYLIHPQFYLLLQVLSDFIKSYQTISIGQLQCILNVNEFAPLAHLAQHVVVASLEVVRNLKIIFLCSNLLLDLTVSIIDDGQEHVEKDKEHKEYIAEEKYGSKNSVGFFQSIKVEISQNCSQQGKDCIGKCAVIFHLGSKYHVAKLSKSKEYNEEHHCKTSHISSTPENYLIENKQ